MKEVKAADLCEDSQVKTNSPKAWLLATRPKTLTGAAAPVLLALALAWRDIHSGNAGQSITFEWIPAMLCLLFALLAAIGTLL